MVSIQPVSVFGDNDYVGQYLVFIFQHLQIKKTTMEVLSVVNLVVILTIGFLVYNSISKLSKNIDNLNERYNEHERKCSRYQHETNKRLEKIESNIHDIYVDICKENESE